MAALLFTLHYPLFTGGEAAPAQSAAIISTVAGNGTGGYRAADDGGPATMARLNEPFSVAVDGAGNLYIADRANQRIRKVDTAGVITTFAGTGTSGYSGDGGAATLARINFPLGVAADGAGNIYIADSSNHRIRRVDTAGVITTFAGTGPPAGYSGDGGAATAAQFNLTSSVAPDGAGNVYISDTLNHRIRKVDAAGVITTFAGTGTPGYSGDGGAPDAAQLRNPSGIAVDSAGNLYIADRANNRIRKVTIPPPPPPPPPAGPEQPPAVLSQSFALSFPPAQGGAPEAQTITLYAQDGAADFQAIAGARWIEAAPRSGTLAAGAQTTITVTVNPAGLSEGTYRARLYIRSGGRVTATIRIVLEVPPPTGPAVLQTQGVVNAARMSAYGGRGLFGPQLLPLAPGAAVVVQGVNFAPGSDAVEAEGYPLPTMQAGTRVLIDGMEAPLFAVGAERIEAQLPWALGGETVQAGGLALAEIVVESGGAQSWPRRFWAAPSAPGVFTVSGAGQGQAAVMFAGAAALAAPLGAGEGSRPARAGDVLEIYATGLGAVEPPIADGRNSCAPDGVCLADGSNAVLRHTAARPRVWIGAYELAPENIRFSGLVPSMAGMNLVIVEVPRNLTPSPSAELRLAVGGRISQSGVTIAVE